MDRRKFLASSTGILTALAGCSGTESTQEQTTDSRETTTTRRTTESTPETTTTTETTTTETTTTQPETDTTTTEKTTTTSEVAYTVRIEFEGEWQGSITAGTETKSIDGTGTETYTITGNPYIVAANAQKETGGSGRLTVQILKDGEVIGKESTTAAYGLAQATSEDGSDIEGGSGTTKTTTKASFAFKVIYDGEWQGAVNAGGSMQSIDGTGTREVAIDGSPTIISGNAQKQDDSSKKLTVQILKNGEVVKEASTTAAYGMAQVSYTAY